MDLRRSSASPCAAAVPSLTPGAGGPPAEGELEPHLRAAHARASALVGKTLKDKWLVERLLGLGGMALVFAARHRNGRRVAIKCMRPELAFEPAYVERFLREGYVANKIDHPGAVAILDDDTMEDGTPFLVMELLSGTSVRDRLTVGPMPLGEAVRITVAALDVLAAAHDKGVVHRDVKPDNLFVSDDGAVKVLDFGIARLCDRTLPPNETQSGTTMGTVGFMPPEQARGLVDRVDARSDVWAMGATFLALATGQSLHVAPTANEALLLAMTTPVLPMSELAPLLPQPLQLVLDRALAFEQEHRYPSARAMKDALEAAYARGGAPMVVMAPRRTLPPGPGVPMLRRRVLLALGAATFGTAAVIGIAAGIRSSRSGIAAGVVARAYDAPAATPSGSSLLPGLDDPADTAPSARPFGIAPVGAPRRPMPSAPAPASAPASAKPSARPAPGPAPGPARDPLEARH